MTITQKMVEEQAPKIQSTWFSVPGGIADTIVDQTNSLPSWQFRISIKPTRKNALKAVKALATIEQFQTRFHPEFKVFLPDDNNNLSTWDPTFNGGDRDQRGKEICVYMEYLLSKEKPKYYEGQAYPNPVYLKKLMLSIWKALQDEGVELAYSSPSRGEKEVPCGQEFITPFTYSSNKPYKKRHGILHQHDDYNPEQYQDPLESVSISLEDLQEYGIHPLGVVKSAQRLIYHLQHYQLKKSETDKELQELIHSAGKNAENSDKNFNDYQEVVQVLNKLITEQSIVGLGKLTNDYIQLLKEKEVSLSLPSEATLPEKSFSKHLQILKALPNLGDKSEANIRSEIFRYFPETIKAEMTAAKDPGFYSLCIQHLVQDIKRALENEKKLSVQEMMELNPELKKEDCEIAFDYYPQKFQTIYQKLMHCENERKTILKEYERFTSLPKIASFPASYSEMTHEISDKLKQARAILDDYTKSNSWISRVIHAHWNRHHVFDVNEIVKALDKGEISSMEELSVRLAEIPLKNPKGSLARRMEFILLPYAQSLNYPKDQNQNEEHLLLS